MRKIVADEHIPFLRGVLEPWFGVEYLPGTAIDPEGVRDAAGLMVRTRTRCDAGLLEGSSVEYIGTATIGFDHIDVDYCRRKGIRVATAAGCNARAVMQYVGAALVYLSRRGWRPEEKTVGIVGVGNVGSLVERLARECGFRVICCDPPKKDGDAGSGYVTLEEVLRKADIVTFHVPLNRAGKYKTMGMADDRFFGKMKEGAVFINTSRGEVVDEASLKRVIRSGKLSDVVLDVWEREPSIDTELLKMVTLGTPHIAGYSVQGKASGTASIVRALAERFGLPLTDWYPEGVPAQVTERKMSWEWLGETIEGYYDIQGDDAALRDDPEGFEQLRNQYGYREEYF